MNSVKPIKSHGDYLAALDYVEAMLSAPNAQGADSDTLDVLLLVIEDYERRNFPIECNDPIAAIEFRMQEQGLRQKDLIPMIGSRSRVSEVLSGERPLTLTMIRALSATLGIPTDVLVRERAPTSPAPNAAIDIQSLPVSEMIRRGWLGDLPKRPSRENVENAVSAFLKQASVSQPIGALYRSGMQLGGVAEGAVHSCFAWLARVSVIANKSIPKERYRASSLNADFFGEIARLSTHIDGPLKAIALLRDMGIVVVVEPGLPKIQVDGAAFLVDNRVPVIALTLRFDRVDYFWFTLIHELAHVWLHLNENGRAFIDNIVSGHSTERLEKEANRVARDAFIPLSVWKRSASTVAPTKDFLVQLANRHEVHPAILAGRYQFETGNYQRFRDLLGQGDIRRLFPEMTFK